ncbi:MAG: hypothetical protein Q4D02_01790 [Clostridia bacterium]|nr:hypothetical protein [Clostridia bacterium]
MNNKIAYILLSILLVPLIFLSLLLAVIFPFMLIVSLLSIVFEVMAIKKIKNMNNKKISDSINNITFTEDNYNTVGKSYVRKFDYGYGEELKKKEFKLVEPSDYEYQITINKIEGLYSDLGFNVKVINVEKNRYNTGYEIIIPIETNRDDIISLWDDISHEFNVDGTNIKPMKKKANHLMVYVPLEYKQVEIAN